MPRRLSVERHDLSASLEHIPYPAAKLVVTKVTQKLQSHPQAWACLIVGAFYDARERIIWSREIFVLCDPSQVQLPVADGDWFLTQLCKCDPLGTIHRH